MAKQHLQVRTEDGTSNAIAIHPESMRRRGTQPGVILYMDAFGLRPALESMADRLAQAGYLVLVPDLFYRYGVYGPFDAKTAFSVPEVGDQIMGMIRGTTQEMTRRDSAAFIDALMKAGANGKIGVVGYCMGGGRAITAAAAFPDRIAAAASIHGGGLASEAADSPHLQVSKIKGRVYVGSAGIDGSFPPEQSCRLAEALRRAEIDHIIENYIGMGHGWAVPDHKVFDERGAERHWKRLLTFFEEAL